VALYGLEHMVLASRERRRDAAAEAPDPVYWLHLGGFAAYSALIGYLLVERAERGPLALAVYGLAMALHFLIVDHSLREEHGPVYDHGGRWVLAATVFAGWMAGATTPLSEVVFARLFAVLAGGRRDHEPQGRAARRAGRTVLAVLPGRGGLRRAPVPRVRAREWIPSS
jgi:hypothetical protein